MRSFLSVLIFCSAAILPASANGLLDFLLPKHDVQVITVTDTTPAGAERPLPSTIDPVYYVAVSAGYRDLGGIVGGEKPPPKEDVIKTIAKTLAVQGFLPATAHHPPTLLLLWTWGTLNTDLFYDPSRPDWPPQQLNRSAMLRFLGAYKMGLVTKEPDPFPPEDLLPGLKLLDNDTEAISDAASEDLYIAAIAAYDFDAATHKKKTLLWTTKISCPSLGLRLSEVLPAMLTIAGPYVGRETSRPVWINASDKFKPDIKIGDPTLVEFLESDKLPVIDAKPPSAKPSSPGPKPSPGK